MFPIELLLPHLFCSLALPRGAEGGSVFSAHRGAPTGYLASFSVFFCSTAPQAFFRPDRRFRTPSRAGAVKVGRHSADKAISVFPGRALTAPSTAAASISRVRATPRQHQRLLASKKRPNTCSRPVSLAQSGDPRMSALAPLLRAKRTSTSL